MKSITASVLALAFAFSLPISADAAMRNDTTTNTAVIACVKTAVATRESALSSAWTALNSAVVSAYSARASALADAYSNGTRAEVRADVKTAWKAFKDTVREARAEVKSDRADAWKTFKASAKSCKGTGDLDDSTNASVEGSV